MDGTIGVLRCGLTNSRAEVSVEVHKPRALLSQHNRTKGGVNYGMHERMQVVNHRLHCTMTVTVLLDPWPLCLVGVWVRVLVLSV